MSITFPIDLLSEFPGWTLSFKIGWQQNQSRTRGGRTIVRDIGPPLWTASYQSRELAPNALSYWRARLDTLENGMNTFIGYDMARCYPIDDPNGTKIAAPVPSLLLDFRFDYSLALPSTPFTQTIIEVSTDNKKIKIGGLPTGYVVSTGDYLSYTVASGERFLRRVVAGGVAGIVNETTFIEVRPHLAFGTLVGQPVTLVKPWVPMMIVPGSISDDGAINGRGRISFEAMEAK